MKKGIFFLGFYILVFLVLIVNSVYLVLSNVYLDISEIPNGKHISTHQSMNERTVLDVYLVETCVGDGVRVTKTVNGKTENIFWQANESDVTVYWPSSNDKLVIINGIVLDLYNDEIYDSRSMSSIFNDGLMGWDK